MHEQLQPELTLVEVLRVAPHSIVVFEDAGIDYCCRGAMSLQSAAMGVGLSADELIGAILETLEPGHHGWTEGSLADLTGFLARDHGQIISELMPQLRGVVDTAIRTHGPLPLLRRIRMLAVGLEEEIGSHAVSEERDLFADVRELEAAAQSAESAPPQGRISQRVLRELLEHEGIRDQLHTLIDLTNRLGADHDVSELNVCLRRVSAHLHHHIHLENNVLYPRAMQMENDLRRNG